ncbi:MAG: hypothetical protein ACRESR_05090, partial [Gammaproteobacteria bacterium]
MSTKANSEKRGKRNAVAKKSRRDAGAPKAPNWRDWRRDDPEHRREAARYERPIPSRAWLRHYFEVLGV